MHTPYYYEIYVTIKIVFLTKEYMYDVLIIISTFLLWLVRNFMLITFHEGSFS